MDPLFGVFSYSSSSSSASIVKGPFILTTISKENPLKDHTHNKGEPWQERVKDYGDESKLHIIMFFYAFGIWSIIMLSHIMKFMYLMLNAHVQSIEWKCIWCPLRIVTGWCYFYVIRSLDSTIDMF